MASYDCVMESWHSYPSIYAIGHKAIANLFDGDVYVEEKVDGSQFSFGVDSNGSLRVRSKGATMYPEAPEKMFAKAVDTAKELLPVLQPGWTYRCEYLSKPKHNSLAYNRAPQKHLIIFDVNTSTETYLPYSSKKEEAERIGLEIVPLLFQGRIASAESLRMLLDTESVLGGQKIEGVVCKQVECVLFGLDKKALIGKFVSESFKETHAKAWKETNQGPREITQKIAELVATPARWAKSVQHLREAGRITDSPKDIGLLLGEIQKDIEKECRDEIIEHLWNWAWPQIRRSSSYGFPEWYKEQLLKSQFERTEEAGA